MRALEILGEYFLLFFLSLLDFLCEASGRCVSKHLDGPPVCLEGDSGCPDDMVDSSGRYFFLSGWAYFCDLLRGIPFGRHLSSVQTVNPVRLNRILLAPQPSYSPLLVLFVMLCFYSVLFMRNYQVHGSSLQFIFTPGMFLIHFYYFILSFYF
jgi:hypothetical protein